MTGVRGARPEDAAELVRLRRLMFHAMSGRDEPGPWEETALGMVRAWLSGQGGAVTLGAFVVEADPAPSGTAVGGEGVPLAACAVGTIEQRLPAPAHPSGLFGFVFNVCTDPAHRGRGYARTTTRALLDWFAEHGVTRVDLHATPGAERMYRAFGFQEHSTALSLRLAPAAEPAAER